MPKLIQINTVCNGSTGKIMGNIQRMADTMGFETISFYGRRKGYSDLRCEKIGGFFSFWFHVFLTTVFDMHGHGSYFKTKKLVKRLKEENADIIHLHNIHGYYLNYNVLFKYLSSEYTGKIYWTFHDCIPFTGHCSHFVLANCDRWKKQCNKCPNKKKYPVSLFKDRSYKNYIEKKELFTSLKNLTIITPSVWLANLVKKSYFKDYDIVTINNGIDLNIFKPTIDKNIKIKYNIPMNKKIVLGVASVWTNEKGLNDFIKLSKSIDDEYIILLVGLNRRQIQKLKKYKNIVGIQRTENQLELVKIYSLADIYFNPSKEETFSLTTLEALACNTPVIVYDNTPMVEFVSKKYIISCEKDIINKINEIVSDSQIIIDSKYDSNNASRRIIDIYKENL